MPVGGPASPIPAGGAAGQGLIKNSNYDFDLSWSDRWIPVLVNATNPTLIDVAQQVGTVIINQSFTLASPRLIKIEGQIQYSVVTQNSNGNTQARVGFDGVWPAYFAQAHALGVGGYGAGAGWHVAGLTAGTHTAELRVVNQATTGCAVRTSAGAALVCVYDLGPQTTVRESE